MKKIVRALATESGVWIGIRAVVPLLVVFFH